MIRKTLPVALALAALGLSACNQAGDGGRANGKLCANFKAAAPAAAGVVADAAAPVDDCLRRWAYSLAPSRDDADSVADAAVAACGAVIGRWNQAGLAQTSTTEAPEQAISLTTGQPTNVFQEHAAFANNRALLYVVQARAGRCAPPPVVNGAPAGTMTAT